jgi:transcriptional regulator with XRE-family HTH domain
MKTFSRSALREQRDRAGLSLAKLAMKSSVPEGTIIKLEQGHRTDPHASTLAKLAFALGCTIDELFRAAS